ncbi:MAG TPA: hypothetical protein VHO46_15210 [Bacteroidales bacterium]|nr:hypothetical protein [Bacteroidales bacterium]
MKRPIRHILIATCCLLSAITAEAQDLEGLGIKKGIKVKGGVTVSNIFYNTNDTINRRDPYQLILSGNLNLNIFGYDAPLSFTYSNSQRSYTQPFNRLSFNPSYKWIKAYIGQTSMSFSPYTLSGHSFKGAGLELTPGNWRFAMMGGQLKRAIDYDPMASSNNELSYKRMGYGLKLGYEKGISGVIVNVFTAKDDENSITNIPEDVQLHPLQNLAMGLSAHTSLFGHISLEGEYSISVLNSDLRFGSQFYDSTGTATNPSADNSAATRKFDAYSIGAGYQSQIAGIMLKYERVAPEYQSLGAYYFNNDLENMTVSPSVRLLEGRLSLNGNAGIQRNNLDNSRESTTKRFVGAANVSFTPGEKWNMTFNYSNFSTYTNMKPQDDPFFRNNMDSLNFYQVTNQAGGSVNYTFGEKESPANLMLMTSFQRASEANTPDKSDFLTANASYSQALKSADITISMLYNINSSDSPDLHSVYHGPGLLISKNLKERKIRASFNSNYNLNRMNGINGSPVLSSGININYSHQTTGEGNHNLTGGITLVNRFHSAIQNSRREITGTINYSYTF